MATGGRTARRWTDHLRAWFPEREFFMRSQGQVRFIKVTTRMQLAAATVVAVLLVAWLVTMAAVAISQYLSSRDRLALLDREARVATAESRVSVYRKGLSSVASDLTRRQDFIENLVQAHLGELPVDAKAGENVSDSRDEAGKTIRKISAVLPEATGLAALEGRQLAFVEQLTRYADRRAARSADAIRRYGLDPAAMLAALDQPGGRGGPFLGLSTSRDGSLDPRFQRLGISLARMTVLEESLAGIPHASPASLEFISSGFGYRSDPFNGGAAFHAGLDFRGPYGAPIYAAARGTVTFVGQKQGYGNCVEISHGNGLMTRYAHMSRFAAVPGQDVKAGDAIGAIGNSGRSTGPHLHFEVRINERPVHPQPFLEARHVQPEG